MECTACNMVASRWFLKGRMPRATHQLSNHLHPRVLILCRASKRIGAAPSSCPGSMRRKRRIVSVQTQTRKKPTKWRRTECRQTKPLVSCVAPAGFACFYPQDKPRPLISQYLTSSLRSGHAGAMAEKVVTGRRPGHIKPGFRRLRTLEGSDKNPPWSFQRSARGRDETPRRSEGDAAHAQISSRELFPEICPQSYQCRRGA